MDPFNASALKLQKNLLNLRLERDRLRREGNDKEADELAGSIARIEETLRKLPEGMKPMTLQ
ncbi:hypothetical protein QSV36_15925 [Pseudomonas sp. BCRC 81390]|uniref:hypothetical protein n=1 Tax=Pseudomonas sp. BCRC 81390 TaxID=3054778 RepID=UPI00259856A4|nr:hypothetical protein [Pseudomonas sp. BCRC 81390]MDM3887060.1 hypothetical protein [Pseudomonas sp. BCRC 81390]